MPQKDINKGLVNTAFTDEARRVCCVAHDFPGDILQALCAAIDFAKAAIELDRLEEKKRKENEHNSN